MNPLDNPLWSSLVGRHARFAQGTDTLKVYPWEIVPFAAVPSAEVVLHDAVIEETLGGRPFVYFVGTLPAVESSKYELTPYNDILQMVRTSIVPMPTPTAPFRALEIRDVDAMVELTSRVYPAYFRERTIELGEYVGVFDGEKLVAMAGLRMAPAGYRELSGVCTDPTYTGRGYAGMLCSFLAQRVSSDGDTPMLHMDLDNARARRLYEALGFEATKALPMCRVALAGQKPLQEAHHARESRP